mmetsp:Transcript_21743/g.33567  ORF Transcript_21743/g.33567 Transcript_21743/m.33567 type:complete len:99 (+) Transcript_21743:1572-1868(+)
MNTITQEPSGISATHQNTDLPQSPFDATLELRDKMEINEGSIPTLDYLAPKEKMFSSTDKRGDLSLDSPSVQKVGIRLGSIPSDKSREDSTRGVNFKL